MKTGIKLETFYNRMKICSDFKEARTYLDDVIHLFNRVLDEYAKDTKRSFLSVFTQIYNKRSHTGARRVLKEDIELYNSYCLSCANSLDSLFSSFVFSSNQERFVYCNKIKSAISGIIQSRNKFYNVFFSFKSFNETQKRLDFFEINNYIYNKTENKTNDGLVFCVPEGQFFLLYYSDESYNIQRGFITSIKKFKFKRRGEHCFNCSLGCKPTLINGLERLVKIL